MLAETMKILGPYVLIEPVTKDTLTSSGLIIPNRCWRLWNIGKVVNVGTKPFHVFEAFQTVFNQSTRKNEQKLIKRVYIRPDLNPGEFVMFEKQSAIISFDDTDDKKYYFIHYGDCAMSFEDPNQIRPM